jgi:hypothetical protein
MSVYQVKHPPPKRAASRSGAARPPSVSKRHWSWYQSLMAKSRGHRHSRRTTGTTQKPRSTTRTCHVPLPKRRQPRAAACAVRAEIGMGRRQGRHPLMPTSRLPTQGHQRSPLRGGLKRHRQHRVRGRAVRHDTGTSGHSNVHRLPGITRPTDSAEPRSGHRTHPRLGLGVEEDPCSRWR